MVLTETTFEEAVVQRQPRTAAEYLSLQRLFLNRGRELRAIDVKTLEILLENAFLLMDTPEHYKATVSRLINIAYEYNALVAEAELRANNLGLPQEALRIDPLIALGIKKHAAQTTQSSGLVVYDELTYWQIFEATRAAEKWCGALLVDNILALVEHIYFVNGDAAIDQLFEWLKICDTRVRDFNKVLRKILSRRHERLNIAHPLFSEQSEKNLDRLKEYFPERKQLWRTLLRYGLPKQVYLAWASLNICASLYALLALKLRWYGYYHGPLWRFFMPFSTKKKLSRAL